MQKKDLMLDKIAFNTWKKEIKEAELLINQNSLSG